MGMKIIRFYIDVFLDTDAKYDGLGYHGTISECSYEDLDEIFLEYTNKAVREAVDNDEQSVTQVINVTCDGDVTDQYKASGNGYEIITQCFNNIIDSKKDDEMSESEKDFVNNYILEEYSAKIDSLKDPLTYHEIDLLIEHWSDVFVWPDFVVEELMDYARMPKATFLSPTPVVNTKTRGHVSPLELATKKLMFNMADEDSSYENIYFDEFYYDEENEVYWTAICDKCASKYDIPMKFIDKNSGEGTCGIYGCLRKADHYIDMPEDMCKLRGDM